MRMNQLFSFEIQVYKLDEKAKKFYEWFIANHHLHEDFDLTINHTDEDGEVLEIMSHNPWFKADALEELYVLEASHDEKTLSDKKLHLV